MNEDNSVLIQLRDSCQHVTDYTTTVTATSISTVIVTSSTQPVVTATPQCIALTIKKFSIGDTDQTTVAQANLYSDSDIVIDTDSFVGPLINPFPSTDTWYGQTPSLSLLYTCDSEWRVSISYEGAGSYTLVPHMVLSPGRECCWIGLGSTPHAQYIACLSHTGLRSF
jgi:hypothetical protein